jgi:predicted ATPase
MRSSAANESLPEERTRLAKVTIRGFKTIAELNAFEPRDLTVLIGPNGAGKSNFLSFFRMLSFSFVSPGQLQLYVAQAGGASAILNAGSNPAKEIEASLTLTTRAGTNDYGLRLFHAAGDSLVFADEWFRFSRADGVIKPTPSLGAGHKESQLVAKAEGGDETALTILSMLRRIIIHQFHNTTSTARVRNKWDADDGRWLKEDAGNLAPFLYRLQNSGPHYYRRIVETIRLILPFFSDFELYPEYGKLLLRWRERGSDHIFNAGQAADGMIRAMALVALLEQPTIDLPKVLILDEPELGLHPFAIEIIADLIKSTARHVQVVVATQSVALIDRFEPEDIVVTDRTAESSTYRRLEPLALQKWLEEYTLSELWEKNVLGGRPRH